ncbi:hypothetical protein [Pontimicrobium sp. MEBiC01747]|jgi:hypothetical protein
MNTLTKENIEFIDNYLGNSGIIYNDVRLEMIDHIATEIEEQIRTGDDRSFYVIFKDYMVKNKKTILDNYRIFIKATDKRILKTLFKELFSIKGGLLFIIIGLILYFGLNQLEVQTFNDLVSNVTAFLILGFILMNIITWWKNKIRYSALERLLIVFGMCFLYVYIIFNFKYNPDFSKGYTYVYLIGKSILFILPVLFLMTAVKFKKESELKFKNII